MSETQINILEELAALLAITTEDQDTGSLKNIATKMIAALDRLPLESGYYMTLRSRIEARKLILIKKELLLEKYKEREPTGEDTRKLRALIVEMINLF